MDLLARIRRARASAVQGGRTEIVARLDHIRTRYVGSSRPDPSARGGRGSAAAWLTDGDDEWEDEPLPGLGTRARRTGPRPRSTASSPDPPGAAALAIAEAKALQRAVRAEMKLRRARRSAEGPRTSSVRHDLLLRAASEIARDAIRAGAAGVRADEDTVRIAVAQVLGTRDGAESLGWQGQLHSTTSHGAVPTASYLKANWLAVERKADELAASHGPGRLSYDDQLRLGWSDYGARGRANPYGRKD